MTSTLEPAVSTEPDWIACRACRTMVYRKRYERLQRVCPDCGHHSGLSADDRLRLLLDPGFEPIPVAPTVHDPLAFTDHRPYADRLAAARAGRGDDDAVRVVRGTMRGSPLVVAVMDFGFLGGSLGVAAGEAITTAAETALAERLPLLIVTASGGARMQEGTLSLMQMAKTSNAMAALDEAGLLTVTLVTDPTYGGVAASFATLADVVVAEPAARMGFAGPRVIEQTIRQRLPEGFQRAEFLLSHGLVDDVRPRAELAPTISLLLAATTPGDPEWGGDEVDPVRRRPEELAQRPVAEVVPLARHLDRPTLLDHVAAWAEGFVELHGDRAGEDCPALVGGVAMLDGLPVLVLGHQKGHSTAELVRRNFGMPGPAGYRKAARLMRLAAKLRLPVLALVDTPGAYPGVTAEEQGQAGAIAECLRLMGSLPVPVLSVVTGEGGSGGALALGVADQVLICANAIYSVISPEGCAAILWKDPAATARAADALRIDAESCLRLGVVDGVIPEPDGGAHTDPVRASDAIRSAVVATLRELRGIPGEQLVRERRDRFRRFGRWELPAAGAPAAVGHPGAVSPGGVGAERP
ncbi:acetyl-CoA carboxylase carboxyl transferase subunit alpha [Plantactinospora endophytica]|nr:acetyl-CoA carboxylase carboxyl transferase subunit alpha [Plantactinospora endophytica]